MSGTLCLASWPIKLTITRTKACFPRGTSLSIPGVFRHLSGQLWDFLCGTNMSTLQGHRFSLDTRKNFLAVRAAEGELSFFRRPPHWGGASRGWGDHRCCATCLTEYPPCKAEPAAGRAHARRGLPGVDSDQQLSVLLHAFPLSPARGLGLQSSEESQMCSGEAGMETASPGPWRGDDATQVGSQDQNGVQVRA